MKKFFILAMFSITCIFSFAQVTLQSLVKPGTKLIYAVEAGEEKYDFVVTIKALTPALIFDWSMTNYVNANGTITHTAAAMQSANTMYNLFAPGQKTLSDDQISVWLSKNTFAELKKQGKGSMMKMNVGETPKKMGAEGESKELKILVNGEKETIDEQMAVERDDAGQAKKTETYFTFYNSAKMPVIIRMKNDFYIQLKEIKTK
jgi:hypothetical protein